MSFLVLLQSSESTTSETPPPRLIDKFDSVNTTKWTYGAGSSVAGGNLNLTHDSTYPRTASASGKWKLTDDRSRCGPVTVSTTTGNEFFLTFGTNLGLFDATDQLQLIVTGTTLIARIRLANGTSSDASVAWTNGNFLQMRESGGTVFFETAGSEADLNTRSGSYVLVRSAPTPFNLDVGYWQVAAGNNTANTTTTTLGGFNPSDVEPAQPPGAPAWLTSVGATSTTMQVSWGPTTGTVTGFELERDGEVTPLALSTTSSVYMHTGLAVDSQHSYRVRSTDGTNFSAWVSAPAARTTPARTGTLLAIPTYYAPPFNLDPAPAGTIAVANPTSGPGTAAQTAYTDEITTQHNAGRKVIGYVATGYGNRAIADVKADIDKWYSFYPAIDGIFLDEQANTASLVAHYADLYNYIKGKQAAAIAVGNPGQSTIEEYTSTADIIMTFENTGANHATHVNPSWMANYSKYRFWDAVHAVASVADMQTVVTKVKSAERNVGWTYVTDDILPNPWDVLASYWATEVSTVSGTTKVTASISTAWHVKSRITSSRSAAWHVRSTVASSRASVWHVRGLVTSSRLTAWHVRSSTTSSRSAAWHVRAQATASRSTAWHVRAQVTASRSTTWHVRAQATASRSMAWHIVGRVTSSRVTAWHVLARATSSRSMAWHVLTRATSSRAFAWHVRSSTTSSRSAAWHVRSSITSSRSLAWHVRSSTTSSRSTVWHVRARTTSSRSLVWHVRSSTTSIRSLAWHVRNSITSSRSLAWHVRQRQTSSRAVAWHVRARVTSSRTAAWNVRSQATSSRATAWHVRSLATSNRSTTWHVRAQATASQSTTWHVRGLITGSRPLAWNVGASGITSSVALAWSVTGQVTSSRVASWHVRNFRISSRVLAWHVFQHRTASQTATWHVKARATSSRAIAWHITDRVTASKPAAWHVRRTISSARSTSWNVRNSATASRSLAWSVTGRSSSSLILRWDVEATIIASRTFGWNIRTLTGSTLALAWVVRQAATASVPTIWRVRSFVKSDVALAWAVLDDPTRFRDFVFAAQGPFSRSLNAQGPLVRELTGTHSARTITATGPGD